MIGNGGEILYLWGHCQTTGESYDFIDIFDLSIKNLFIKKMASKSHVFSQSNMT